MKKNALTFWVDTGLFGLLGVCLLMALPDVFGHSYVHVLPGLLLVVGIGLHLWLHWGWIKAALQRYGKMPPQVRVNAAIDLALAGAYLVCAGVGLSARLLFHFFPHQHIFLGIIHVLLAGLLLAIQAIHLVRHLKWIKTSLAARILGSAKNQSTPARSTSRAS